MRRPNTRDVAFQTGDDPHRGLVVVVGQVLVGGHLPQLLLLIRSGGRRAIAIAGSDDFVEQFFVIALDDLLARVQPVSCGAPMMCTLMHVTACSTITQHVSRAGIEILLDSRLRTTVRSRQKPPS